MSGIIGKKVGMTSMFSEAGKNQPCTVIQAGPCIVTQIRSQEKDGYEAIQLSFDDKKEKNSTKASIGHFKKANTAPKYKTVEFRDALSIPNTEDGVYKLGDTVSVDIFVEGEWVDVVGTAKGKGFQGVVKRHGFHGVGGATHGQHNRLRAPGSIGAASYPARVFKGMRMGGRMGGHRVKNINLQILKIIPEENLLVVKGSVPGAKGSYLVIEK